MKRNKFIIYILAAFITGTILLIYIQYNSAKNISSLITNNEKYIDEYNINSDLKSLEKDVVTVESNISNIISTNDSEYIKALDNKVAKVENDLTLLQKVSDDNSTANQIDELDTVVRSKLKFSKTLVDSFYTSGKASAEKMIGTVKGKKLMDSIYGLVQSIENTRHGILTKLTISNVASGQKAQSFNTILTVLVLIAGAGLFWYIISAVRRRERLIEQLHESEKMVKETALVKEHFMANMSHEIRTPMNAILGFTNLLQRKKLDEESTEYVATIQRSGENLLTIVNDVLDLSKIEAGMMRIESTPFNIRGLLHSIEVMFASKAREKNIKIHSDIDDGIPDSLEGDATRLTQIFINLIGNALKFTKKGSISIKIANEGKTDHVIKTGITISDTGIGIEKDKHEEIFNRFQQADDTVTRSYGGTGLGLSIVKDLVLLQNGTIQVESKPGIGTSFKLMIPYKIAEEQSSNSFSNEAEVDLIHDFMNVRILVAEDNEINQSLIKHLCKSWGLDYDLAKNGKEALEKLKDKKYSLILMDIQMPVMDGYTATLEIREMLELNTPIIAMTAHALAGEREKCLSYGMNDYISKPIREAQLHQLITQYTHLPVPGAVQGKPAVLAVDYQYINLGYMKEISGGNKEYEKTVTEQFIEAIPEDLLAIEKAWQGKHIGNMRQLAHNMKTTVSVMGLNESLQPSLDALEYEELTNQSFIKYFQSLKLICNNALQEAALLLATF
jgi:signal transduction histidine kinase/CheY-like chemotaxis protein